jgi:hypothetical protein
VDFSALLLWIFRLFCCGFFESVYPELKHDTVSCMKLVLKEIVWALEGFFGVGGPKAEPASPTTSR